MIERYLAKSRVLGAGLAVVLACTLATGCGARGINSGLILEHNGHLGGDAFAKSAPTSSLDPAFRLGGTATSSDASVRLRPDGLFIDVDSHRLGNWRGYFVATSATYPSDSVIHVRMWRSSQVVPLAAQSGIVLLAVQTAASRSLDYVLVAGSISSGHESWLVGYAHGNTAYAKTRILSDMPSTSTTEDVTVRTDGHSRLAVYFGHALAYESKTLRLGVAPPLRVYLEVEERGLPYRVGFQDLWIAAGRTLRVDGLHPGDRVTLTPNGGPSIRAVANAAGQAQLQLPVSEAVGTGTFTIMRRHYTGVAFAGGDVYVMRN